MSGTLVFALGAAPGFMLAPPVAPARLSPEAVMPEVRMAIEFGAAVDPVFAATGMLVVSSTGALLLNRGGDTTATPFQETTKISKLKEEGAAAIALREARAAALAAGMPQYAPPDNLFGKVVPVEATFARLDKDGSGSLDESEVKEALVAAGRPADEKDVRETFAALDTDQDGKISLDEFKAAPRELAWWEKGSF